VDEDDLLARVQGRARLYGRNESRRAVCAVVAALDGFLPARAVHQITAQLPVGVRRALPPPSSADPHHKPNAGCRGFLARIAERLFVDGPNAAFLARAVFEQLNATTGRNRPATFAQLACPDLRPLLCARVESDSPAADPAPKRAVIRRTVAGFPPVRVAGPARLDPRRSRPAHTAEALSSRSHNWAPARTRAST
jgi:uncharacterized protein (DUF2267 family)